MFRKKQPNNKTAADTSFSQNQPVAARGINNKNFARARTPSRPVETSGYGGCCRVSREYGPLLRDGSGHGKRLPDSTITTEIRQTTNLRGGPGGDADELCAMFDESSELSVRSFLPEKGLGHGPVVQFPAYGFAALVSHNYDLNSQTVLP